MLKDRVVVAALVGSLFAGALAAAPQGAQGPSARFHHSMAYDSVRKVVVLFGGTTNNSWPSGVLSDTWEWDGSTWTERFPANAPSPRAIGSMCFDASRGVCVYFGGAYIPGNPNNETWEWDGVDWVQAAPGASPPARRSHSMTYDALRQRVVMAGSTNGSFVQDDFWEYDGHTWMPISGGSTQVSGPSARASVVLAYGQVVGSSSALLFGGETQTSSTLGGTWKWDGTSWLQLSPVNSPPPTAASALAYDTAAGHFALFGGRTASGVTNATWVYGINDWTQIMPTISPAARQSHQVVYDQVRHEYLMFGGWSGTSALGDTWTFDGTEWRPKLDYVTSPVNGNRYALTPPMTWQEAEQLAVLEGGHLAAVGSQSEQMWLGSTFVTNAWIGFNDAAAEGVWEWSSGEPVTFTFWCPGQPDNSQGSQDYAVLTPQCGSAHQWDDGYNTQAWPGIIELPGGPVTEVTVAASSTVAPQPLRKISSAPLPTAGALAFGGETANGPWAFTYEWTSSGWHKQFSVLNPMPRTGHSLILDETSQDNVLFGGANPAGTKLAETWTYQGGQWTYRTPATAPAARSEHAMVFDPVAGLGVLFGGEDAAGTTLSDMWTWDGTDWAAVTPATLPPPRSGHGLAYDRYRSRLVLFGGTDGTSRLNDIWEWDGADWSPITPAQPNGVAYGPSGRDGFVMEYDPRSERVVVIGGEADGGCVDDVWSWDGVGWTRHFPTGTSTLPSPRKDAASFVDAVTGALRLVGGGCGSEFSDELWELQLPVFARSEVIGVGCAGSNGVPILEVANGTAPVLGTQLDFAYRNGPTSPLFIPIISTGFDDQLFNGIPLPLPLGVIGLPGCVLYHSAELTAAASSTPVVGEFSWSVPLPTDPVYLGQEFFFQGLHLDLGLLPTSVAAMSNAVGIRIGDQ